MGIHDGHRDRLRRRFADFGLDAFTDVQALELLLFYAKPRQDTNELAHRLLQRFGSLEDVFNASMEELSAIDGVGSSTAVLLRMIPELHRRMAMSRRSLTEPINSLARACEILKPLFDGVREEQVYLVTLDARLKLIKCSLISKGSFYNVTIDHRDILTTALQDRARAAIIAHNHIVAPLYPSREDISATQELQQLLSRAGITLMDHIVVSEENCVSMNDLGLLTKVFP